MIFIKDSKNRGAFVEPNYATVLLEEDEASGKGVGQMLLNAIDKSYLRDSQKKCNLTFYRCTK
jgi:hypothetical protein